MANTRYYIGNRPLLKYENSRDQDDIDYGRKILNYLKGIHQYVAEGGPFDGVVFLDQNGFHQFEMKFPTASSSASAAVEESKPDTIEKQIHQSLKLNPNELSISREFIGYMNYAEVTKAHSIDLKKKKYEFDNFAIQLKDESVIEGKLEVDFVNSQNLQFELTLNKPDIVTEQFIECMQDIPASGYYVITSISLTRSQIIITGTVSEI